MYTGALIVENRRPRECLTDYWLTRTVDSWKLKKFGLAYVSLTSKSLIFVF